MNKKKILNDPVYGFINIPDELIFDIINHPYFQRLRRIKQLGVTDYVYPGALHTRFHHALGAMHLMGEALQNLRGKGHEISNEEFQAAQIAILLHDIGHGPFSHALEATILQGVHHEQLSLVIMEALNEEFNEALDLAIAIFKGEYERPFFHQLVSSQLDIDRLDYLQRDCYFTGVSEGTIGAERIIKMLDLMDDELVVEKKGIYSVENFLNARRLMYWQVYLHKTAIAAEQMLIMLFKRAKHLAFNGKNIFAPPALAEFLRNNITADQFRYNKGHLESFAAIDDYDIWGCIKVWREDEDRVLATLSQLLLDRKLFKIQLMDEKIDSSYVKEVKDKITASFQFTTSELDYFFTMGTISNEAYVSKGQRINILTKKGEVMDVAQASDLPNIKAISKIVTKYYICWPKKLTLHKIQ